MPIIQNQNPIPEELAAFGTAVATAIRDMRARKQAEQDRQDRLKQQAIANALAQARLQNDATNSGNVVTGSGADVTVKPWTPPPSAPSGAPAPPPGGGAPPSPGGLMGAIIGAPPAQGANAPKLPTQRPPQGANPAQTPQPGVPPELLSTAATAHAMSDHLTDLATKEQQQAELLSSQGAPYALIKRHQDAAKDYFAEAGTQTARYLTTQQQIDELTGKAKKDAHDQAVRDFVKREQDLPTDPNARLRVLLKRIKVEQGAGVPTNVTQQMISDTEREITEARNAANQRQRLDISLSGLGLRQQNAANRTGDPQSYSDVSGRIRKAKTRDDAQAILDSPEGSLLSDRQYSRLQKQVDETFGTHGQTHKPPPEPSKAAIQRVETSPGYNALPSNYQTIIIGELKKGATIAGVRSMIESSKAPDPAKKAMLGALSGL